jgi:aminoglycoside 3-N-acetyltransferase
VVVVHSAIWGFAHRFGVNARQAPARLVDLIIEAAGTGKTIVMPTYTFAYCGSRVFDPVRTKAETGVLGAELMSRPGAVRSRQPIYSHVALGPRAAEIADLTARTAWGRGSAMDWFLETNARYALIGVPFHLCCSLIHASEERELVPYRYHKVFGGKLEIDGEPSGAATETFYVRPRHVMPDFDYVPATEAIRRSPCHAYGGDADIFAEGADARSIIDISDGLLRDDPYAFVRNAGALQTWRAEVMEAEIGALDPSEVPAFSSIDLVSAPA